MTDVTTSIEISNVMAAAQIAAACSQAGWLLTFDGGCTAIGGAGTLTCCDPTERPRFGASYPDASRLDGRVLDAIRELDDANRRSCVPASRTSDATLRYEDERIDRVVLALRAALTAAYGIHPVD